MLTRIVAPLLVASTMAIASPTYAIDDNAQKVLIGAAAVAGIAAIIHSQHHHDDSKHHHDEKREAAFERGYRDGLQNARYNDYKDQNEYLKGYNAGIDERQAHVHHNQQNRWEPDRHAASNQLMHQCAVATAHHFDVSPGHVTPISSEKKDHHLYKIKLKYGHHKLAYCSIHKNGEIKKIKRAD
ncbi:MAG: hypothetical protein V7696_06735 [Halioglobus sp.]